MLENISTTVTTYIEGQQLLPEYGTVVVAFSGGADSLCLLHLLHQICGPGKLYPSVQLHVAHLNHQLRGAASAQDAAAVARIVEAWGLPITVGSVDVPSLARREQRSLEDAARAARYRFLREVAQGQPIAVAHHADDQVETLLLHWLRGGGITSMVGLQPQQQDIIRPLLTITHADALAYCAHHQLTPLEDASNTDVRFLRNRIRHELLPQLEAMNAGFRATLLRNAEVMQVDTEWIEAQVDACWPTVVISMREGQLHMRRSTLLALPLSLQRHLLRRATAYLCEGQSPLELRHYKLIEQFLKRNSQGRELMKHLPRQIRMTRVDDAVLLERVSEADIQRREAHEHAGGRNVLLSIPGRRAIPGTSWEASAEQIPDEQMQEVREALQREDWAQVWRLLASSQNIVYIDSDKVEGSLLVRTRQPGDRIRPLGMAYEKKVQDILVDKHVVRSEREQIPLFFSEQHCIWLAGICIDERVRLTRATQRIARLAIVPL